MEITKHQFQLCGKNDAKAQEALYDAYKAKVMGICRRYSAGPDEAEDLLQEAFIRIFHKIKTCKDFRYLNRWIYKTTVNTAINQYYKNKRNLEMLSYEEDQSFDEEDISVLEKLSNKQLIAIINELPDGYRVVFNLYVIEGYKHNEIAKALEISENTSKSQLSRAKVLLRERLNRLGITKFEKYG